MKGSQQYLNECSYSVDLESLYEIDQNFGTCAYNDQMDFVPVQVKVKCKALYDGANYLLQVWNKFGNVVF